MKQHIILLHGLARTSRSMRKLATSLEQAGFSVDNRHYVSTQKPIAAISDSVIAQALATMPVTDTVHFVTHSLGGILLRYYLSKHSIARLGRVVMLAPPNQGSEVVDKLKHGLLYRWFNGPAGQELGTDHNSLPKQLPNADYELGIIAGTRSVNCYLSTLLPSPNDGKVSVEATKLNGMKAHLTLAASHSFIMQNKHAINQTIYFIKHGQFKTNSSERNH